MKSLALLGAEKKKQFPEYNDLTDLEVGRAFKLEYPDLYKEYGEATTALTNSVAELHEYYNPHRGRITSWWQQRKSESRAELQAVLNKEQELVLEMAARYEQQVMQGKMREAQFNEFITRHQLTLFQIKAEGILLKEATEQGYTLDNWQDVKLGRERTDETIRLERELSGIRIHEFKEIESFKLNNEIELMREKVRLAIISKTMVNHQKKALVQELLDNAYTQIEEIQQGNLQEATKQRMIEDREALITSFKEYRDNLELV